MKRVNGLVLTLAALSLLAGARGVRADNPGEVLLENHLLRQEKKTNKLMGRFQVGGSYLHRTDSDDSFSNINFNVGLNIYKGPFFVRSDGSFAVARDDAFEDDTVGNSMFSAAGGYQLPFGRSFTAGAWIGWARFNTDFEGDEEHAFNLGVESPYVGAGINYTLPVHGKPSKTSIFLGGRYYWDPAATGELRRANADAQDGYEFGGGVRYRLSEMWYVTAGATYRHFNIDVPLQIGQNYTDYQPSLTVGVKF